MGAVANLTIHSPVNSPAQTGNSVHVTDVLAAGISPALVKSTCMMGLMHTENLPQGTMTAKLRKLGYVSAANVAEGVPTGLPASGQLTDTSVAAQIVKCAVVTGVTVEEGSFGNITADRVASEHGSAIGRAVDNDALSLFGGLSAGHVSASVLTIDDVMLGQFNIFNSECPNKEVPLKAVLSHRGHYNIKKEIISSGASVWTNQSWIDILGQAPAANCYVGSLGAIDFYATSGHTTQAGLGGGGDVDAIQAIFHPMWAFAGFFAPAPITWVDQKGSEGFYTEYATYFFYDVAEWNDLCGYRLLSDA